MKNNRPFYEFFMLVGTLASCTDLWIALKYASNRQTIEQANLALIVLVAIGGWIVMGIGALLLVSSYLNVEESQEEIVEDKVDDEAEYRRFKETWITLDKEKFDNKRR